jgi:hypothetical protein
MLHKDEMMLNRREDETGGWKQVERHRSTWMKGWIGK